MSSDISRTIRNLSAIVPVGAIDEARVTRAAKANEVLRRKYIPERASASARFTHDLRSYWHQIAKA